MSDQYPTNGTRWRLDNLDERVKKLEAAEVSVLSERVSNLKGDVTALKRGFYTFAFSVAGGAILFALSVIK